MRIAIISAMDKERDLILPLLDSIEKEEQEGLSWFKGKIGPNEIIVTKCGIGKVNAAINTYKIISSFHPELIINTGVAGGASLTTEIGDILVADYVAYHDVWCGPGTEPGVADGMDVFFACDRNIIDLSYKYLDGERLQVGLICSGDQFITGEDEIRAIQKLYPQVLAVDMESAAIAQVCFMEKTNFNIIRVISDTPGSGKNIDQYKNFWKEAPEKTFRLLESILKDI